jgi:predicted DNA-binding transcriptional regulator AlpA
MSDQVIAPLNTTRRRGRVDSIPPAYLDGPSVAARYSMSQRHLARLVQLGQFPAPHKFGRLNRWLIADLETFDREQAAKPSSQRRVSK